MSSSSISDDNRLFSKTSLSTLWSSGQCVTSSIYLQMKLGWVVSSFVKVHLTTLRQNYFHLHHNILQNGFHLHHSIHHSFLQNCFPLHHSIHLLLWIRICIGILIVWHICVAVAITCLMLFSIYTLTS